MPFESHKLIWAFIKLNRDRVGFDESALALQRSKLSFCQIGKVDVNSKLPHRFNRLRRIIARERRVQLRSYLGNLTTLTGFETVLVTSQIRVIFVQRCVIQRVNCACEKPALCRIPQNYAVSVSEFVRKLLAAIREVKKLDIAD